MNNQRTSSVIDQINVDRARLDSITVYEVTEDELEIIEQGSPSSTFLNLSIALLSICISFIVSLSTTEIQDDRKFIVFVLVTIVSGLAGVVFLLMWGKTYKSSKRIFGKIRARKKTEELKSAILATQIEPSYSPEANNSSEQ